MSILCSMVGASFAVAVTATAFTNDSNTLLLLHMDGTDATAFFEDDNSSTSRTARTLTANGNAQVDTAQYKFGQSSMLFDGTGDYFSSPAGSQWDFGTGSFTIEYWIRFNVAPTLYVPIALRSSGSINNGEWWCEITNAEKKMYWGFKNYAGTQYYVNLALAGTAFTTGQWYHIALVNNAGTAQMYVNGTATGATTALSGSFGISTTDLWIGAGAGSYSLNGWMDEVRISNTARYTANFTAPTTPFANDGATLLLVHAEGPDAGTTVKDDNGSRLLKTITANGNAQIDTAANKFGGAAALFDGNGDYLTLGTQLDLNFGKSDFTIEAWVYFDQLSTTNRHTLISNGVTSFTTNWIKFSAADLGAAYYPTVTAYNYSSGGAPLLQSSTAVSNGQWYHIAYVRYNTDHFLYLDGVQVASNSDATAKSISVNFNANNQTQIGRYSFDNGTNPSSTYFDGWIDELRISHKARYNGTFTPGTATTLPTVTHNAAFVDDGSTKLLLHFEGTNGYQGSISDDNSSGRTAITGISVSNAGSIRTSDYKFGSSSVGSTGIPGGWGTSSASALSPNYGDFTIEFWCKPVATANSDLLTLQASANGTAYLALSADVGAIQFGRANVAFDIQYLPGTALSTVWHHIAIVKTAGFIKIYQDGTQVASEANTVSYTYDTIAMNMGGIAPSSYFLVDEFRISHIARYTANFTVA